MVWGTGGSGGIQSCDSLLKRLEANDPKLVELVILPMKNFGAEEVERLAKAIADGTNTTLQTITASGHSITQASSYKLAAAISAAASRRQTGEIQGVTGVTSVAIGDGTMGDEGVVAFCTPLEGGNGCGLEVVDFSLKQISKDGAAAINRAFGHSPTLHRLHIYRNTGIGDDGIEALCRVESSNDGSQRTVATVPLFPALDYLDLSDCDIREAGARSLVDGLMAGATCCDRDERKDYLQQRRNSIDLILNENNIGPEGCYHLAKIITLHELPPSVTESYRRKGLLRSLKLQNCSIGDEGLHNLLRLMTTSIDNSISCLNTLDLTGNGITGEGSLVNEFVTSALARLNLKELCLAHNPIGEDGIMELASSLETNCMSVKEFDILDLTNTGCGINGALAIFKCRTVTFKTLRLFNNALGSDGGFETLSTCYQIPKTEDNRSNYPLPSIVNLDLGGNRASETSVVSFLKTILEVATSQVPFQLQTLEIGGNKVGESVERVIKELNDAMPTLDLVRDKVKST